MFRIDGLMRRLRALAAGVALAIAGSAAAAAQTPERLDRELRVFFDCPDVHCDEDFLIEQIPWVDFVRDRAVADVHVLVTSQRTGGGGAKYTLRFIGRDRFAGREHALSRVTAADATDDDERRTLAQVARLGLAVFAGQTSVAPRLDVSASAATASAAAGPVDDPWNRWVFDFGLDSHFDGEDQYQSLNLYGWAGASRVTETWKLGVSLDGENNTSEFVIDDSTTVESRRESYGANTLAIRSISPRWSMGGYVGWSRSTRNNYESSLQVAPAVEYSIFPYEESSRRLLTVMYAIGPRYFDYAERTIFGRTHETLLQHILVLGYAVTQPWGTVDVTLDGEHYLAPIGGDVDWIDPQYSVSLGGGLEVRLIRGLSLRLDGSTELVRDQIQLPAGGLTEEEILTQQRELATGYRYWGSFGLSYEFGSIYSSVVNRRLDFLD